MRDPYEVLGVAKNASAKDIKAAYRKLAKKHHPDQNPNDSKAKDRFSAANQAYEILGDEKQRAAFDRGEIDAEGKPKFQGFEGFQGGHPGGDPFARLPPPAGPAPAARVSNSAAAAIRFAGGGGSSDDIFSETVRPGLFAQRRPAAWAAAPARRPAGRRRQRDARHHRRGGRDRAEASPRSSRTAARLAVKLPAYVEDGQTIRLKGQGEQGHGGAGDALVKIRLRKHPRYRSKAATCTPTCRSR